MESGVQLAQSFIKMRASQEYRDYLRAFAQNAFNNTQILSYINSCGSYAHPNKIAEDLSITSAQMAVLLNHLEDLGYIERIPDENDHRKTNVILTGSGKRYHMELSQKYQSFICEIFARMGAEDSARFVELFSEFVKAGAEVYSERT